MCLYCVWYQMSRLPHLNDEIKIACNYEQYNSEIVEGPSYLNFIVLQS